MADLNFSGLRVYIDDEVHNIFDELVSRTRTKADEDRPFKTMKDVFMIAACLGAKHQQRGTMSKQKEIFNGNVFDTKTDAPVLAALAYQYTQDLEVLDDSRVVLDIAQDWANGGIYIVKRELLDQPGRPLQNLLGLLLDNEATEI